MRWSPKSWPSPRSRRTREAHEAAAFGYSMTVATTEILKELYPDGRESFTRPAWAKLAKKHGWMSSARYYSMKATEPAKGRPIMELMYANSPFVALLKKDWHPVKKPWLNGKGVTWD